MSQLLPRQIRNAVNAHFNLLKIYEQGFIPHYISTESLGNI
jgi:hypothetical protein